MVCCWTHPLCLFSADEPSARESGQFSCTNGSLAVRRNSTIFFERSSRNSFSFVVTNKVRDGGGLTAFCSAPESLEPSFVLASQAPTATLPLALASGCGSVAGPCQQQPLLPLRTQVLLARPAPVPATSGCTCSAFWLRPRPLFAYSARPKINIILEPNMQINTIPKIIKIFLIFCDE